MKKSLLLLIVIASLVKQHWAQDQHLIDSLTNQLKKLEAEKVELRENTPSLRDTVSAKILSWLSNMNTLNNPEKAMDYARQCLTLSEQIGWEKGTAHANLNMGEIKWRMGDYLSAITLLNTAMNTYKKVGWKKGLASTHNTLGNILSEQGNYPEALKNHLAALRIREELGEKTGMAGSYHNIGNLYLSLRDTSNALKNLYAALAINKEIGNKGWEANNLGTIGVIYQGQRKYQEAMQNYLTSLKIFEEVGDNWGMAASYTNIGIIYFIQKNYEEALKYEFTALKLKLEMDDKYGIAESYSNIGEDYFAQKKYDEALDYMNRALSLSKEIGALELVVGHHFNLSKLDSSQGKFSQALEQYKLYIIARDSLLNNANTKKITQQQMQYDFDKKELIAKAEQEKKDAISEEEIENQKLIRNGFIGGFAAVLLFAGTFFRQRNRIKKGKKRSDELLLNILPEEIAEELKETGGSKAKTFSMVTVMFTDFKDFTKISEKVSAELLVNELHTCFSAFDTILQKHSVEKIKTIGDAYMCVCGLPVLNQNHAVNMVNAAIEILDYIGTRKKEKDAKGEFSFELRIGMNTGPVVAGIVGLKKFSYDIWGDTVNTAARMENQSEAGKINISGTTYELVKDKFTCSHRGKVQAKNKGEVDMYFVN